MPALPELPEIPKTFAEVRALFEKEVRADLTTELDHAIAGGREDAETFPVSEAEREHARYFLTLAESFTAHVRAWKPPLHTSEN